MPKWPVHILSKYIVFDLSIFCALIVAPAHVGGWKCPCPRMRSQPDGSDDPPTVRAGLYIIRWDDLQLSFVFAAEA